MEWQSAGERYKSPELPYEIRFFSAVVDAQGEVTSINAEQIFAVDESAAAGYALAAAAAAVLLFLRQMRRQ